LWRSNLICTDRGWLVCLGTEYIEVAGIRDRAPNGELTDQSANPSVNTINLGW